MFSARLILIRAAAALVLVGGLAASALPLGPLPPLGPFLDPVNGVWAVARRADLPASSGAAIPGLTAPVDVRYDDRGVPHIFAATPNDAYRALGYVVARDRLFQLELQTRATAGRLTELVGPSVLGIDREARRLSLAATAERSYAGLPQHSPAANATLAYADGVNAFIDGMKPADLPIEYRLLNAKPMRWEPVHSIYLLRRMGYTLTYQTDELRRDRVAQLVGAAAADALFPVNSPIQEPIEPGSGAYPRYDWTRLPPPGSGLRVRRQDGRTAALPSLPSGGAEGGWAAVNSDDAIGSNNWAVAPSRSATGHALLAGDPHLDLSLPSIWYEAHLVVGREASDERRGDSSPVSRLPSLDVYGVTIPGVPGVVIGFNRNVAWTFTNTEADVLDYYAERVDDRANPAQYYMDGAWRDLTRRVETYRDQRGRVLAVDTVRSTHRGPIVDYAGTPLSVRWTVNESAYEVGALLEGATARNAAGFQRAIQSFSAPPQNMLAADRGGSLVIRSTGRFPIRPGDGRGTVIRDGTTHQSDWRGDWWVRDYPDGRTPDREFLSSANQQPIDPTAGPLYLGADWVGPWRAIRINALLRADSSVTVDKMRRWQTDPGSARAEFFIPYFLRAGGIDVGNEGRGTRDEADRGRERVSRLPSLVSAELLSQWDRRYTKDNTRAILFESAMDYLSALTWDELEDSTGRRIATPRDVMLAQLLQDPKSEWWDRRETAEVEDRDAVLRESLTRALSDTRRRHGEPDAGGWQWDRVRHANIHHLLRIPAFSALEVPVQGGRSTLNPSSGDGTHGASWRMVVELGDSVTALGIYPGGQSGNPVSPRYLDRLPRWVAGELDTLLVPHTPADLGSVSARLDLAPRP